MIQTPLVLGFDEVGRGCLAGPVVAACVGLPTGPIEGITDSKKLTALKRERLERDIRLATTLIGVGWCSVSEIDLWNIRVASLCAMLRSFAMMAGMSETQMEIVRPVPFERQSHEFQNCIRRFTEEHPHMKLSFDGRDTLGKALPSDIPQEAIVKGDSKIVEIGAASIVAKVYRDAWMNVIDQLVPHYGFASHKGYGSDLHVKAIHERGVTAWHRRTFSPVKELVRGEEPVSDKFPDTTISFR